MISANTEPRSIFSVNTDKQVLKHLTVGTKISNEPRTRALRHINATHTSSERHQAFQRLLRKEATRLVQGYGSRVICLHIAALLLCLMQGAFAHKLQSKREAKAKQKRSGTQSARCLAIGICGLELLVYAALSH